MTPPANATMIDGKTTWVPIAMVAGIVTAVATFAWTASEWRLAIANNTKAIEQLTESVQSRWTARDMKLWVDTLQAMNVEMHIPPIIGS